MAHQHGGAGWVLGGKLNPTNPQYKASQSSQYATGKNQSSKYRKDFRTWNQLFQNTPFRGSLQLKKL